MTALETKSIDEITADDVRAFVAAAPVETETLEFKREADSFAIRRAVCGLANTYGGAFVLGVAERAGAAAEICVAPDCAALADRIGRSLAAGISPPLTGLRVRAIPIEGEAGVIVIRAPASLRRPHSVSKEGRGDALHVFVRRGAETRPADIREVQDMTLSAASGRQNVLARIAALKSPVIAERDLKDPIERPAFQVFLCAVPLTPIRIPRIGRKPWLQCGEIDARTGGADILWRWFAGDWRPAFQSLRMTGDWGESVSRASVHADGACEFHLAMKPEPTARRPEADQAFCLGPLLGKYVALALTCEKIRRVVEDPTLVFAVSAYIACDSTRVPMRAGAELWTSLGAMTTGGFDHDVVELADEDDLQRLLNDVVADFYGFAGRAGPEADQTYDLEPVRRVWGLSDG